jgi:hypothetical protein
MNLEHVRQKCIQFKICEKYWKKHPPAGKTYTGFKFEWDGSTASVVPVFKKKG